MMNAANGESGSLILVISERVIQHELRFDLARVGAHVRRRDVGGRPSLQPERQRAGHGERVPRARAEARKGLLPIDECSAMMTEDHDGWRDEDYETDERTAIAW